MLALTTTLGCRQSAAQRELLERELRLQEDRIYELEAKLEDTQRLLERHGGKLPNGDFCPPSTDSTFRDGVIIESTPSTYSPGSSVRPGSSSGSAPATSPRASPADVPHDTAPPKVELPMGMRNDSAAPFAGMPVIIPPDPNKPEGLPSRSGLGGMLAELLPKEATGIPQPEPTIKEMSSPKFRSPSDGFHDREFPPVSRSAPSTSGVSSRRNDNTGEPPADVSIDPAQLPTDMNVASIGLHRSTGGWNSDGAPGDDGVFVLLEPRNKRGEVVPTIGEVSIVLIDPAIDGEGGRYARWDFTSQDSGALYRPAVAGGSAGMHFELAWPDAAPTHNRMKLFIRFTTEDGRRLQAERDVKLELGVRAATDDVILEPVPLTATGPATNASTTQPAAAVNIETDRATRAVAQPVVPETPLRWGGPKVSTQPHSALESPAPTPASNTLFEAPATAVPSHGPTMNGPALGPTLAPPQNGPVWRR
ncbi:MAG: hypothetical protein QM775_21080 [Pirellulales bacterium]